MGNYYIPIRMQMRTIFKVKRQDKKFIIYGVEFRSSKKDIWIDNTSRYMIEDVRCQVIG